MKSEEPPPPLLLGSWQKLDETEVTGSKGQNPRRQALLLRLSRGVPLPPPIIITHAPPPAHEKGRETIPLTFVATPYLPEELRGAESPVAVTPNLLSWNVTDYYPVAAAAVTNRGASFESRCSSPSESRKLPLPPLAEFTAAGEEKDRPPALDSLARHNNGQRRILVSRGQLPSPAPANGSLFPTLPFSFIGKATFDGGNLSPGVAATVKVAVRSPLFPPKGVFSSRRLSLVDGVWTASKCGLRCQHAVSPPSRRGYGGDDGRAHQWRCLPWFRQAELVVAEHPDSFAIPRHSLPFGPQQLR
nr:hypothetical protein Iba_chr03fCG2320 [Ipomoea batatas]